MDQFKIRLSLRYKMLLILVTLPLMSLSLYLLFATTSFQEDKIAYVYDSSAAVSRSLATQVRMDTTNIYGSLRSLVEQYDMNTKEFNSVAKELFQKSPKIHAIVVFRRDAETGQYTKLGEMVKDIPGAQTFASNLNLLTTLRDQAVSDTVFTSEFDQLPGSMAAAFRLGEKEEPNHMVMMGLYQAEDLLGAFQSGLYSSFVITRAGRVSIGGIDVVNTDLELLRKTLKKDVREGTAEMKLSDGATYLISYSNVGMGDLTVLSKADKAKALLAVEALLRKSLALFVVFISLTILISVMAAGALTSTLRELFEATQRMSQGDFNVQIKPRSQDEVGGLAVSFNFMAAEVSRLMSATAEKARMESELSTVRTVQETLFPAAQSQFGPIRIMGHFEPASECGGDWWNYSRIGEKIYLWIGDATGHGAPAALITSAARSATAVIESLPDVTPARAMTILNRAIHQTSKGQIMMTFFIACIDLEKNTFTYSSASHDPPYFMRRKGEKLSKKDLVPLNEVNGPRLGDQKDHQYDDISIAFEPGDLLFLYTDGILDIQDGDGKKWGERAFLKSLIESANVPDNIDAKLQLLRSQVDGFRNGSLLIDDVTMVMCEYEKRVA